MIYNFSASISKQQIVKAIVMEYLRKLAKLKIFRHRYKDPLEFYDHVFCFPVMVASLTGVDVWTKDYTKSTWKLYGSILAMFVFAIETISTLIEVRNSIEDLMYCLITIGLAVELFSKIYTHFRFRDELLWIQKYTKDLIREETKAHKSMLMGYIEIFNVLVKIIPVFVVSCSMLMLIITLLSEPKSLAFGFWLPIIDRYTWTGYILNVLMQLLLSFIVVSEGIGLDSIYFLTVLCSVLQLDMIKVKVQNVNDKILKKDKDATKFLHGIFKRHYEHMEFVRTIEKIYRGYFFVLFSTYGAALVLMLYAIVVLHWGPGFVNGPIIIHELFAFCLLPTLLEIKKDELMREIYNITWYEWPVQDKRKLRFMLEAAQQPNCLTMIFYPLNMPTFASVINTIYSILTLLLTFRNE